MSLTALCDMHVHFRQGEALALTVPETDRYCDYALVMPNTDPPITDAESLKAYKLQITDYAKRLTPLMTLKLTAALNPEAIYDNEVAAVKLYPEGVTTNSADGISLEHLKQPARNKNLDACLSALQSRNIPLCVHGEAPNSFCMNRERDFLYILRDLIKLYPSLRIVMEHITTRDAVEFVKQFEKNCVATITLHHLMLTLDDVVGDTLQPHHFCKPIAKTPADRFALMRAAFSGSPSFFLGSDTAPHAVEKKECSHGCAGVFTAPVLPEALYTLFKEHEHGHRLPDFACRFGRAFYGLPEPKFGLEMRPEEWKVPERVGPYRPFLAGKTLPVRAYVV